MKAVIMAGGRGSRLSPLTSYLPKPMVPLLDRPCMEYIIELLKRYDITDIAVTVQYLPQVIRNHFGDGTDFGVNLHFFEESTPLGTAGSVKNAEEFLNDTFVVISGDALTDINLQQAIEFHHARRALGTLILKEVVNPVEYGIVLIREDGRIARFLEKPSWSEVFSNTANTGIYVLEPEVLHFFDKGQVYDFSKDLFPHLMKRNLPLFGVVADGYWSDIGNLVQYRQTQFDMLDGLVNVNIKGNQALPGIWLGQDVKIDPTANISAPAFIGDGTVIESEVELKPYTITGRYNRFERNTVSEQSVIWNRCFIGSASRLEGATLCDASHLESGIKILENSVVGGATQIGKKAVVLPGVKIWPNKRIEPDVLLRHSLIWGHTASSKLFDSSRIIGIANVDMTPDFAVQIAGAYGAVLNRGASVIVSSDDDPYSSVLKYSLIANLLASGIQVHDVGESLGPLSRYACRNSHVDGGIHIHRIHQSATETISMEFMDPKGCPITKALERKIETALSQENAVRPEIAKIGVLEPLLNVRSTYLRALVSYVDLSSLRHRKWKVVYSCETPGAMLFLQGLLQHLGCITIMMVNEESSLAHTVTDIAADFGVFIEAGGKTLRIVTEEGNYVTEAELQQFLNTPTFFSTFQQTSTSEISVLPLQHDAFFALAVVLNYLTLTRSTAQSLIEFNSSPVNVNVNVNFGR